jgi:NTP pyrophosphatase (non-canonical NTP hydrolase)
MNHADSADLQPATDAGDDVATLRDLAAIVTRFRDERNWAQFHTLRNLIVSLHLEAGELLELTQWKPDDEIDLMARHPETRLALQDECADVLAYLLLIADRTGIDLTAAFKAKMAKNALKYPVEGSYGSSRKYTEIDCRDSDVTK